MDFFEVIAGRRSVRKYKKDEIDDVKIEKMIEAAKYAASARSEYPWHFIVIKNKDRIKELAGIVGSNGKFMAGAAAVIVVISKDAKYYLEDGSAATQNLLNAAYALGIGTCWIAGDKKDYCAKVLEFTGAPEGYKLVSIISCGIPDEKPVKNKPENKDIMSREKFGGE